MSNRLIAGIIQRLLDFVAVIIGFVVGYWIYTEWMAKGSPNPFETVMKVAVAAAVLFIAIFHYLRLYERQQSLLNLVETKRLIKGWILGSLLFFSIPFFYRALDLSRLMIGSSQICVLLFLLLVRSFFYQMRALIRLWPSTYVVVYGAGFTGRHLYKRIHHSPGLEHFIVGFLDDNITLWGKKIFVREVKKKDGCEILGGIDRLETLAANYSNLEVMVAMPTATYQRNMEIVERCRSLGIKVSVVPPTYGSHMHQIDVQDIGGIPILREKLYRPSFYYPLVKRIFDLTISVLALVLLGPVILMIGLAVRLDSPGPVIFRQRRVGLNGKEFDFFKFRTMYYDSNPYAITPSTPSDPRITNLGRWLRRSSLDELPQFLNVILGDMSIVGPRPEMPFIVNTYNYQQRERLSVKPGITGIWQISAVRGEPIHANIEYDLFYIENQSILLDVIVMLKTVVTAARGIGAV